jgi:hypothetical protein
MLCHEDRMPAVGRLLPILVRSRRSKALGDELGGVLANGLHATKLDRGPVAPAQVELGAKALTPDGVEALVDELDVLHGIKGRRPPSCPREESNLQPCA